jgi:hypothetical protein
MEFEEIINHQRQSYIKQLKAFYADRTDGAREILMALNGEEETLLFKLTRLDYLVKVDGEFKIEELSPDTYSNHSPINFTYGQLQVELNPFFWHGCEFIIDKKDDDLDWLRTWTKIWIDEEDKFQTDIDGFTGAIHNVSFPTTEQQTVKFTVDFGTASTEVFMNLMNCIKDTGAKRLIINSFDMLNE